MPAGAPMLHLRLGHDTNSSQRQEFGSKRQATGRGGRDEPCKARQLRRASMPNAEKKNHNEPQRYLWTQESAKS